MGDFASIAAIVLLVLLGPWVLVWRVIYRRKRERAEDQEQLRELISRTYTLEETVRVLQAQRYSPSSQSKEEATPKSSKGVAPVSHEPSLTSPTISFPSNASRSAEPIDMERPSEQFVRQPGAVEGLSAPRPMPERPPIFAAVDSTPSLADRFKSSLDIEEMMGTNWLNKLGIIILVLGVAFFLAYQLKTLGPAGKVMVGFATAAVMLGAGVWFDRGERYRVLARAAIGGGWALTFFTTYAMYHVPAARVLSSQAIDLVMMLAVAVAMVLHTLRYRSQVVTGLAFLLAFMTVAISHSNVYSLSAGAVLSAGLVLIVLRMQWFELEIFGILTEQSD